MNQVTLKKVITDCTECPDFRTRQVSDPFDLDDLTPDQLICDKTNNQLQANRKLFHKSVPIPNDCPRLKEEKEREL